MPLYENENRITLEQAVKMTTLYRANKEQVLAPEFRGKLILPISESFNREAFDSLLANKECVGVRAYFSMDEDLQVRLVFVGVDAKDNDILPSSMDTLSAETAVIVESGTVCPPRCPIGYSPLNPTE